MKKLLYLLCGLLLFVGVLVLPAAAKDEAPQPEETVTAQEQDPAPSPYTDARDAVYSSDNAKTAALAQWKKSGMRAYYFWSRGGAKLRPAYRHSFRQYYKNDPEIEIVNHLVLRKVQPSEGRPRYELLDYFDTDKAESRTRTLRIPAMIGDTFVVVAPARTRRYSFWRAPSGYKNNTVTKLIIEGDRQTISPYAFASFTALKTVELNDSIGVIAEGAFRNCKNLTQVKGATQLQEVEYAAFSGCEKLDSFEGLACVQRIWSEAFAGCGFRSLELRPDAATSYSGNLDLCGWWGSFENCKKLKTVTYTYNENGNWNFVGPGTFYGCTALTTVTLQNKCRILEESAFEGCTKLTELKNTGRLYRIGPKAFKDCTNLKSFVLPKKCTEFGYDTFLGCTGLKKLVIKDGNKAKLFAKNYDPEAQYAYEVTCNFLPYLPETCTVVVYSKAMKQAVLAREFPGTVRVK